MEKFIDIFNKLVIKNFTTIEKFLVSSCPKLLLSICILFIGWGSAIILKKIISKLLKALGFDIVSEKIGIKFFLNQGGIKSKPSLVVGLFFYWLILFSTLIMIFNTLEIEIATKFTTHIIFYLPKVIISLILLSFVIFVGRFFGEFVEKASRIAKLPFYLLIGKLTKYAIIGLGIGLSLEYIGVEIALEYTLTILAILLCFLGIVFIISGKDILSNMLATRLLVRTYKPGDIVKLKTISGKIQTIDLIATTIKTDTEEIIIPNSEFIKNPIKKVTTSEK